MLRNPLKSEGYQGRSLSLPKMSSGANAFEISDFHQDETTASLARRSECNIALKTCHLINSPETPIYYVEDVLGTSRVITTNTGVVCYDTDFYPDGGERPYANTCPQNYKFEGKERDTETGNDDFGARYYSNRFGRWLSADWSAIPVRVPYANLTNPQTLNLYAMVAADPNLISLSEQP